MFEENREFRDKLELIRQQLKKEKQNRREYENMIGKNVEREIEKEFGMRLKDAKAAALTQKSEEAALDYAYDTKEHRKLAARFENAKEELLNVYREEVLSKELDIELVAEER